MGVNQLLALVLSVILVGISYALLPYLFRSSSMQAAQDALTIRVISYSARAQQYYRTPETFGGGGGSFAGYYLTARDTGDAAGSYSLSTTAPAGPEYVPGSVAPVSGAPAQIYILGCGRETGKNGTHPVKVYARVTPDTYQVTILN